MGTVARRLFVLLAVGVLLGVATAHAGPSTFGPPYKTGPQGGDQFNVISADSSTGDMTVLRLNPAGLSGGLGCTGQGGFSFFEVDYTPVTSVSSVAVAYTNALVDPYSWINVGVRQGDRYVASSFTRGPIVDGDGVATVHLSATGPIVVWFGLQVASACPNVDGAHATFTSVTITEA